MENPGQLSVEINNGDFACVAMCDQRAFSGNQNTFSARYSSRSSASEWDRRSACHAGAGRRPRSTAGTEGQGLDAWTPPHPSPPASCPRRRRGSSRYLYVASARESEFFDFQSERRLELRRPTFPASGPGRRRRSTSSAGRAWGLTEAEIIAEAKASRGKNPEAPDGPKALDRWMEHAMKAKAAAIS